MKACDCVQNPIETGPLVLLATKPCGDQVLTTPGTALFSHLTATSLSPSIFSAIPHLGQKYAEEPGPEL